MGLLPTKCGIAVLALAFVLAGPMAQAKAITGPKALSMDQCADQYVIALSPRGAIVGLSPRVFAEDSYLRTQARGLSVRRADRESTLAIAPDVVVRYWGGDPGLVRELRRRGARIAQIEDAEGFEGVRRNIRVVAAALNQAAAGERLIQAMNAKLTASAGAWQGRGAVYLTSGGATAGTRTLIDAILQAAGLRNLTKGVGFREVSLEQLTLDPPQAVVAGFFDAESQARVHWGPGRHGALRRLMTGRTLVSLPASVLGCPAWFAADAVQMVARAAPARTCRAPVSAGTNRCA